MTATNTKTDPTQRTYSKAEYEAALAVAKHALKYVAEFQTPPTPEVYEVWFRYSEGNNPELKEQLEYAVKELKTVDRKRIEELHNQFFARADLKNTNADLTNSLASEMGSFESMIQSQIAIGNDFDAAVSAAGENLQEGSDPGQVRSLVETVVSTSETMRRELGKLRTELEASLAKVESLREEFHESQKNLLSDPLTGVGNRRLFDTLITQSVEDGPDARSNRLLMLIDLDKFKEINDTFGHAAGDEVLKFVAYELQQLAPDASITRYGGDEFAMFLDAKSASAGEVLANEIREFFTKNQLTMKKTGDSLGAVTLSIGVAVLREHDTAEAWFGRADKLLYTAKQSGRNRVYSEQKLN